MSYESFLAGKAASAQMRGMKTIPPLSSNLFPFQRACVAFTLEAGGAGLFLDTGLGKTLCQLEYCEHARHEGNGKALLLTPLAVSQQIHREGQKFGYPTRVIREQDDAGEGINILNYERLHLITPSEFSTVSIDESSILKSFTGKTTKALIDSFSHHRFKLSATATPAPNDHVELGNHAAFCGVMAANEMLSRFFINDASKASQEWRLKHHAVEPFWNWMASWSRLAQTPSDLGDKDDGFLLPPIKVIRHRAHDVAPLPGCGLFGDEMSATSMHEVKRRTADARAEVAAELVASDSEPWVVWVDTDYEADAVMKALAGRSDCIEVRGSQAPEQKERGILGFLDGTYRVLITKPSICGFGLNMQHCARTSFVGRSFSYESWYQAVRRFWRFGQKREVQVHLIVADGEDAIGRVIDKKADSHAEMKAAMRAAMLRGVSAESRVKVVYEAKHKGALPSWLRA